MNHNPMTKPAAVGGLMDRLLARADNCNLWASLQPMHDATGGAIITLMVSAEEIYNNILAMAGEHKLATSIYSTCVKDMNQAVSEVEAIHGQWAHRSGFAASQQDLALMGEISDQYRICNERFQQLAVQNVMELTTILADVSGGSVQAIDAEGNPVVEAGELPADGEEISDAQNKQERWHETMEEALLTPEEIAEAEVQAAE